MVDLKRWLKFELNCTDDPKKVFEEAFCKEFFAIQQWFDISNIKIIKWARWIENEPINWLAFQSKYFTSWNWNKVKESLENVLKYHSDYFPDLKKIIVYVKEIWSDSYLKEKYNWGIIERLKWIWVEVEFFEWFDIIDTNSIYNSLQHYFKINEDNSLFLKLVDKYIQNLFLSEAKEILDILWHEWKYINLNNSQKYEYHRLLWNFKFHYNTLIDLKVYSDWKNEYIEAYKYDKSEKGKNTYSVALIEEWKYDDSEKLLNSIFSKDKYSEKIYHNILRIKNLKWKKLEDIESELDSRYSDSTLILSLLWSIANDEWNIEKSIDYFSRLIKKDNIYLRDKLNYLIISEKYLSENFDVHNLSLEWKKKYLDFYDFYLENKNHFETKNFKVLVWIFNVIALIDFLILKNREGASYYFKKSCEITYDPVVNFNYIKLLYDSWEKNEVIIEKLESLLINLEWYIWNSIIEQAIIFLAQIYGENDVNEGLDKLNEYLQKFWGKLAKETIESINLTKVDLLKKINYKESTDFLNNLLEGDKSNIRYIFYGYYHFKDVSFLERAYDLYIENKDDLKSIYLLELADQLVRNKLNEKAFNLFKNELKDFSKENYVESFIHSAINLWKIEEFESIINNYIESIWWKDNHLSIFYKSYIEYLSQNYNRAIEIIIWFDNYNLYSWLLLLKADLMLRIFNIDWLKDCIKLIIENHDYKTFSFNDKIKFINLNIVVSPIDSIKKIYRLISIEDNPKNKEKLVWVNFWLFLWVDLSWLDSNYINEDSYVVIKNLNTDKKLRIVLDWYSTKDIIFCDYIFKPWEWKYEKLIWKKKSDIIDSLFDNTIWLESDKYEIESISNKYIELHKQYYENHENLSFMKAFQFNEDTFIDQLREIWLRNSTDRIKKIDTFKELQKKWNLAFWMFCKFNNISYIEWYNFYILNDDFNFISDTHYKYKDDDINWVMLDVSSIQTIFRFDIWKLISDKIPFYINQSTKDYFLFEKLQLELNPNLRTAWYLNFDNNWNPFYTDIDKNSKENQINYLDSILWFIEKYCEVLSSRNLIAENEIEDAIWKEFSDAIIVAEEKQLVLLTDDLIIRKLYRSKSDNCLSMESLILLYKNLWYINDDELYIYLLKLIEFNYINLSEEVLKFLLKYTLYNEKNENLWILLSYNYNIEYIVQEFIIYINKFIRIWININDKFIGIVDIILNSLNKKIFVDKYIDVCMNIKEDNIRNKLLLLIGNYN